MAAVQGELVNASGRWVHTDDLHITLRFLGSVPQERMACIAQAAEKIRAKEFSLSIDRLSCWPRPGIVWAGPTRIPQELKALVKQLTGTLNDCGCIEEKRRYQPHVTLLRQASPVAEQALPQVIEWHVDHFVLVESRPGGEPPWYSVIDGWPLAVEHD